MRATIDIDEAIFRSAARNFPEGTPKTVIIEEALRQLAARRRRTETKRALGFFAEPGVVVPEDFNEPLDEEDPSWGTGR